MSTTTEKEIDYQAYLRENPPDLSNLICGPEARERRREAVMAQRLREKKAGGDTGQSTHKEVGLVNGTTEKEIDYQAYLRENPPDLSNLIYGPEARERRRETAMARKLREKRVNRYDGAAK